MNAKEIQMSEYITAERVVDQIIHEQQRKLIGATDDQTIATLKEIIHMNTAKRLLGEKTGRVIVANF